MFDVGARLKAIFARRENAPQEPEKKPETSRHLFHHREVFNLNINQDLQHEPAKLPTFNVAEESGSVSRWNFYLKVAGTQGEENLGVFLKCEYLRPRAEYGERTNKARTPSLEATFNVKIVHPTEDNRNRETSSPVNDYMATKKFGLGNIGSIEFLREFATENGTVKLILDFFRVKGNSDDKENEQEEIQEQQFKQESFSQLVSAVFTEFEHGNLQDCEVHTNDGKCFKAHRVLLAARSKYFKEAVHQEMEEKNSKPFSRCKNSPLIFKIDKPASVLGLILCHIYTGYLCPKLLNLEETSKELAEEILEQCDDHGLSHLRKFLINHRADLKDIPNVGEIDPQIDKLD